MKEETLIRFLNNQSSPAESREVSDWLNRPGADQEVEELLKKRWETNHREDPSREAEYQKLLRRIHVATGGTGSAGKTVLFGRRVMGMGKIAATYLLWVFSAYLLYQSWQPLSSGTLVAEKPVEWIERETVAGEKLTIILPDGSRLIMNSLSKVTFSSDYGKTERLVQLEGEAYFEVAPDPDKPFKVKSGPVVTEALGTAFNAYSRDDKVEIHLTEGRVSVTNQSQAVKLNPGEMAAVKDRIDVGVFDKGQVTAWKEGKITFKKKNMAEILSLLEKWYGVTFTETKYFTKSRTVTGTFNNENLEDILNGLGFSVGFTYQIDGKNVKIQ